MSENQKLMCECADCLRVVPLFVESKETAPKDGIPYWADCPECGITGIEDIVASCFECGSLGVLYIPTEDHLIERRISEILGFVDCESCGIYHIGDGKRRPVYVQGGQ